MDNKYWTIVILLLRIWSKDNLTSQKLIFRILDFGFIN
jgi:hypothetical protein